MAGGNVVDQLTRPTGRPQDRPRAVDHAIALTGRRRAARPAGRAAHVGRAAARRAGPQPRRRSFDVILLDEPSSGLDLTETERFGGVLQHVVAERGTGLLLVEHDMALVMDVCEHIYVMDFGRPLFDGTPEEVRASELVQAAYLGSDEVEAAVAAEPAGSL